MPRFVVFTTLPYQDRTIINVDAIAIVTSKPGPDGVRSAQLQMLEGSKVVITATIADLERALSACPSGSPAT